LEDNNEDSDSEDDFFPASVGNNRVVQAVSEGKNVISNFNQVAKSFGRIADLTRP
jgi:hypothetical protein